MGGYSRHPGSSFGISSYFPYVVKWLLILNSGIFVAFFFLGLFDTGLARTLLAWLGVSAAGFLRGMIWQPFTYMFLHDPTGFGHILFNMLTLWMFGADLERDWGSRQFLRYYVVCGVGAGLCDITANLALGGGGTPTIGSSGAIYGILLAFGLLYPTRTVYFSFLFPIQARYFVLIMGVIAFMSSFSSNSRVSNVAHLGGMLFGYLYLRFRLHRLTFVKWNVGGYYQQWRRKRMQKKFEVYMRKVEREQERDRWVN
jgi:membrane associated rhomboid family serine protease